MKKLLVDLRLDELLSVCECQTQTGSEIIDRYRSFLMENPVSYQLVNNFIKEASTCKYDNGINYALEVVSDFINTNKTSWALASVCENINNSDNSRDYLNKNAARQVEKLLEMEEDDIVKYIKAGALKNVMYCESFRNIAKQVYKSQPIIETAADYTIKHPVSIIENMGDSICFEVQGQLYKMDNEKHIQEAQWSEVSNTFRNIATLLESNICSVEEFGINVQVNNALYTITEAGHLTKTVGDKEVEMTTEQLRDNNRLQLMTTNPRNRNQMAYLLESLAQLSENYDKVVYMDNVAIYTTKNDQFLVIECGQDLYATLLKSNRCPSKWTINEGALDALTFIKKKTNVSLNNIYENAVDTNLQNVSESEKQALENDLRAQTVQSYKERIEALTEKFKDDPVKLALLSNLAVNVARM